MAHINLDYEEKGILKYLGKGYEKAITLDEIKDYLKKVEHLEGEDLSKKEIRSKLDHLIDVGYVRSKTEGTGEQRKEKFYLSNILAGIEGGVGRKKGLQGRGPWHDLSRLVKRLFGFVFFLSIFASVSFLFPNVTGNTILGNITGNNSSLMSFGFFVFALLCGFAFTKLK
jgi:hypothetical protein